MKSIQISQWHTPIHNGKGTVLDRALQNGIPYPHQCRSGECGRCKSRLISGSVKQQPCLDFALNAEDKANNLILACRSIATSDVEIAWLEPDESNPAKPDRYSVRVVEIERRGAVVLLTLTLNEALNETNLPFSFRAGQYVNFILPDCPPRPYSMASVDGANTIEFHIEQKNKGWASEYIATRLAVDDTFILEGPFGDAWLRIEESGPLIAVASGTGLAPVLAIVKTALLKTPDRPITLIYAERSRERLYLVEELRVMQSVQPQLKVHLIVKSGEKPGEMLSDQVMNLLRGSSCSATQASFHIAGSPVTVAAVAATAKLLGQDSARIRADAFTQSAVPGKNGLSVLSRLTRLFSAN